MPRIVSRYATCGLPMLASTLNSRRMRSTRMSRWSSPMPEMTVWPVSSSLRTRKVGSSSARRWIAAPSFSWSDLVFGSMATWMTGSGNVIDSRMTGLAGSHSVSPVVVCLRPCTAMMSPAQRRRALFTLVGVHLVDLADPLFAVLGGVDHLGAGVERAGVDPDVGQLAEVLVRLDLEGQAGERLGGRRLAHASGSRRRAPRPRSPERPAATAGSRPRRRAWAERPCS